MVEKDKTDESDSIYRTKTRKKAFELTLDEANLEILKEHLKPLIESTISHKI